jgi:hypothetical protein
VIDGSKQFITNATTAALFVVFAPTAAATSTSPGIAVFLVPADAACAETSSARRGHPARRPGDPTDIRDFWAWPDRVYRTTIEKRAGPGLPGRGQEISGPEGAS